MTVANVLLRSPLIDDLVWRPFSSMALLMALSWRTLVILAAEKTRRSQVVTCKARNDLLALAHFPMELNKFMRRSHLREKRSWFQT
jgi:hypothetical protein